MKTKLLPVLPARRERMPLGGYSSCLPPVRVRPPQPRPAASCVTAPAGGLGWRDVDAGYGYEYVACSKCGSATHELMADSDGVCDGCARLVVVPDTGLTSATFDLANLCDADILRLEPVVAQLKAHDWYYDFSDDANVWRRGEASKKALHETLAALPLEQATALWGMYAPPAFGSYRRPSL